MHPSTTPRNTPNTPTCTPPQPHTIPPIPQNEGAHKLQQPTETQPDATTTETTTPTTPTEQQQPPPATTEQQPPAATTEQPAATTEQPAATTTTPTEQQQPPPAETTTQPPPAEGAGRRLLEWLATEGRRRLQQVNNQLGTLATVPRANHLSEECANTVLISVMGERAYGTFEAALSSTYLFGQLNNLNLPEGQLVWGWDGVVAHHKMGMQYST